MVDDFAAGSSPTSASAPPVRVDADEVARGAARRRPGRGPGALPYQKPVDAVVARRSAQVDARAGCPAPRSRASSSFSAGRGTTSCSSSRSRLARQLQVEAAERRALVAGDERRGARPARGRRAGRPAASARGPARRSGGRCRPRAGSGRPGPSGGTGGPPGSPSRRCCSPPSPGTGRISTSFLARTSPSGVRDGSPTGSTRVVPATGTPRSPAVARCPTSTRRRSGWDPGQRRP